MRVVTHVELNSVETGCKPQKKNGLDQQYQPLQSTCRPDPTWVQALERAKIRSTRILFVLDIWNPSSVFSWCYAVFERPSTIQCMWMHSDEEIFVNWIRVHNFLGWSSYSVLFRYVEYPKTSCCVEWQLKYALAIICTPHCICCMEHKSVVPHSFKRPFRREWVDGIWINVYEKGMEYRHWLRHTKFQSLG